LQVYHKYEADYKRACALFVQERDTFYQELSRIPYLRVYPSQANYFLCEVLPPKTATALAEELLKQKIFIKDCSAKKGFAQKNYIRIAIRNREDNAALAEALKQ
jgi:histidinol-phosphate/aromatic aminotransferase/cobyric acid decarboxylase-like protein